jgi:hypothetical protein
MGKDLLFVELLPKLERLGYSESQILFLHALCLCPLPLAQQFQMR